MLALTAIQLLTIIGFSVIDLITIMPPKTSGYSSDAPADAHQPVEGQEVATDEAIAEVMQENEVQNDAENPAEIDDEIDTIMNQLSDLNLDELNVGAMAGSSSDTLQQVADRLKEKYLLIQKKQQKIMKEIKDRPTRVLKEEENRKKAADLIEQEREKMEFMTAPRVINVQIVGTSCILQVTVTMQTTVGDVRRAILEALNAQLREMGVKKPVSKENALRLELVVNGKQLHLRPRPELNNVIGANDMTSTFDATLPNSVLNKIYQFFPLPSDDEDEDEDENEGEGDENTQ